MGRGRHLRLLGTDILGQVCRGRVEERRFDRPCEGAGVGRRRCRAGSAVVHGEWRRIERGVCGGR
eukprot:3132370-Prymnesium_polylepis.1